MACCEGGSLCHVTEGDCQSTVLKGVVCKLLLFRIIGVMFPSIWFFSL